MRRSLKVILAFVAFVAMLLAATTAGASAPATDCPSAAGRWILVDRDGWWDQTVLGFLNEGIPVYLVDGVTYTEAFEAFSVDFGFANAAAFESFVRNEQFEAFDNKNADGLICMKDFFQAPGSPDWLFVGRDNHSAGNNPE